MTTRMNALAVGTLGVLLMGAGSSFAHHAWAVDTTRSITVKGTT